MDPSQIQLSDLFTDGSTNHRRTDVYANNKMLLLVFPTVNYFGDPEHIPDVIEYVAENVIMMELKDGNLTPVDTDVWIKSREGNEYSNDINRGQVTIKPPLSTMDIRIPLYFRVPLSPRGEMKWVAKLGDQITSTVVPVEIGSNKYTADHLQMEIADVSSIGPSTLRVMRYKHGVGGLPNTHKLYRFLGENGIKIAREAHPDRLHNVCKVVSQIDSNKLDDVWDEKVATGFAGILDIYGEYIRVGINGYAGQYTHDGTIDILNDNPDAQVAVVNAPHDTISDYDDIMGRTWDEGIPMIHIYRYCMWAILPSDGFKKKLLKFEIDREFFVEDNFGNRMALKIDWNADEKPPDNDGDPADVETYYKYWEITDAETRYENEQYQD